MTNSTIKSVVASVLAVALMGGLSGCSKKATGQVVAVVNGEEITVDELNAELKLASLPPTMDKKLAMRFLLQQIVERKLLAQTAKDQGFDRNPAFVLEQRRMNEDMLVRMFAKKTADTIPVPDAAAVSAFMASNPQMFGSRTRYKLEQLTFDLPADPSRLKALEPAKTMAEIKTILTGLGISFQPSTGSMDSGVVDPTALKQILARKSEPFVAPAGNKVVVSLITGEEPMTVEDSAKSQIAVQAIRSKALDELGRARFNEAKTAAKIEYQPGYEPPPAPKGQATAAAK